MAIVRVAGLGSCPRHGLEASGASPLSILKNSYENAVENRWRFYGKPIEFQINPMEILWYAALRLRP